jgi:hypothetical protein
MIRVVPKGPICQIHQINNSVTIVSMVVKHSSVSNTIHADESIALRRIRCFYAETKEETKGQTEKVDSAEKVSHAEN